MVEQVAGASLPSLLALVSKSLVRHKESGRFDLHEVVRQYALSHLTDDPQGDARRDRHCEFYLALLRDQEKALKGVAQRDAIRELTVEIDNVRAAWAWAVEREKFAPLGQALRSFGWLCDMRGWLGEGIEQTELIVQTLRAKSEGEVRQTALGLALTQQGMLYFRLGQYDRALSLLGESLEILRPLDKPALLLDALIISGIVMYLTGEIEWAQQFLDEGVACAREAGDLWSEALGIFNQGYLASLQGRYAAAYEQMRNGLAIWRTLGDPRVIALALNFLSPSAIQLGHIEQAQAFLQESLELCKQVGDRWGMGTAYRHLGLVSLVQEDIQEAQSYLHKSLGLFTELGAQWDITRSLIVLGETYLMAGGSSEARRIYLDALHLAVEVQATPLVLDALMGLAQLQAQAGNAELALGLSIYVLSQAASTQEAKGHADRLRLAAEGQLTAQKIDAARQWASTQSLETILAEIL